MNYVVFDLEWNQPYGNDISFMKHTQMPISGEIIQIGAVKLNEDLQIIDQFSVMVKPKYLTRMHKHVRELTGITNQDLDKGVPFKTAFVHFDLWCGEDSILLSWGSDDVTMLRENIVLHKIKTNRLGSWVDAQLLYAYERHGNSQQVSVQRAMEDLQISAGNLLAHNALNDAIFTAKICQNISFKQGLLHYESIRKLGPNPFLFPPIISFFIYENFQEKKRVLYDRRIRVSYCPYCQKELTMLKPERQQGDKFLALGHCSTHGQFAIQLRIGKYTKKNNIMNFFVTKAITHMTDEIRLVYEEKARINREKEAKYLAKLQAQKELEEQNNR